MTLSKGRSYLSQTSSESEVNQRCMSLIGSTSRILIVSREPSKNILKAYPGKEVECIWLTDIKTEIEHLNPMEIEQLCYNVEKFVMHVKNPCVLISGIEYLISYTSFKEVFHMVNRVKDLIAVTDGILVIHIGTGTLRPDEENILRQEFEKIGDEEKWQKP
jgi:hypothetical protein